MAPWHGADGPWHGSTAALVPALRDAVRRVNRDQPILHVATMDERLQGSAAKRRFALLLLQAFGLVALLLVAVGTYSLLAGSVTERARELAVRAALGASRGHIVGLVLRQGLTKVGLGVAAGAAAALVATRALETLLFGVTRLDLLTYAGVIVLLAGVSLAACGLPAWRAARIDPNVVLRAG